MYGKFVSLAFPVWCIPVIVTLLQEQRSLPGLESALLSNTWQWVVWGCTRPDKQETLLGRGALAESSRLRKSWRLLCHVGHSLRFYGDEISFWVVSGQSFWLRVLSGSTWLTQPISMPARGILGGGRTHGISFWPFLNSSIWWCQI